MKIPFLSGGRGILALPSGVVRLSELPVFGLHTNAHGTVQVEEGPGFVRFQAAYHQGRLFDSPPQPEDHLVPPEEANALHEVVENLQLANLGPGAIAEKLRQHFAGNFDYTTQLTSQHQARSNRTALAAFLLEAKSGHCEYFATATALLLRAAGVPARYAVGYAVQEKKGRYHLVRNRHAHAWAMAWINGRWEDIDTTPGTWVGTESRQAPFWEPLSDFFSRAWFEFSKWRWGASDWKRHLVWLVLPLVGWVTFRVIQQKQWKRVGSRGGPSIISWPGLDSELYRLEEKLRGEGILRSPGQTLAAWLPQVLRVTPSERATLIKMLHLHQQLRFDPNGLTAEDRATLQRLVEEWLQRSSLTPSESPPNRASAAVASRNLGGRNKSLEEQRHHEEPDKEQPDLRRPGPD